MKKVSLGVLLALGVLSSCKKDNTQQPQNAALSIDKIYDAESNLKRAFGKALLTSMNESPMLRQLLKDEALKMFDKDYEVLYYLIKDKKLENGKSVEEVITSNLESKNLNEILDKFPTLTILIPELPNNSFSAETWNAITVTPAVAIRTDKHNDIPMIKADGTEEVIPSNLTPGFPVIVVGINERVISSTQSADFESYKTRIVYNDKGVKLRFWADGFDNPLPGKDPSLNRETNTLDQKIIDAYNIYKTVDGWQRDYIYYGIKPSTPNGPFSYEFKEHLREFMVGNATDGVPAYNKISDQSGDPVINNTSSHWSSGYYEFKIKSKINGKNGVGDEIINGFSVNPNNLFDLTYTGAYPFLTLISVKSKSTIIDLPLFNWKLEDYSTSIKIGIEEVDLPITTVSTESRTSKYAANFSVEGTLLKMGLKFGASAETTGTKTVQTTTTQGSDDLYEAIVNFADKVIIIENPSTIGNGKPSFRAKWSTYNYSTGWCTFSIEPKKVQ